MQDRFKFRVWDNADQEFVEESDIFRITQNGSIIFNNALNNIEPEVNYKRLIVEQCTGLRDKNGSLIYEGDIISDFEYGVNCIVKFGKLNFKKVSEYNSSIIDVSCECFYFTELETGKLLNVLRQSHNVPEKDWEIIGNIHETPELLENN
ncbi:MAG: YopX family protein [Clostridium sp.]|nr:YopX family protein [Clostridium sp.]